MSKAGYLLHCALRMNYRQLFQTADRIHAETGRSKLRLLIDMTRCGFRYGAGYKDYQLYRFYELPESVRATYVTRGVNNTINHLLNDPAFCPVFDSKEEFYKIFGSFLGRNWIDVKSCGFPAFSRFMEGRDKIVVKPGDLCCGQGVEIVKKSDYTSVRALYDSVLASGDALAEEVIVQHPEMQRLNPGCVNTVRVGTVNHDGKTGIVYAYVRIGNSSRPVDNLNAGGMCAPVDLQTGVISRPGYDKNGRTYTTHPASGCEIAGFQIPFWPEAKELCLKACAVVPQVGYVGWDVAFTAAGPVLIEGNNMPGHDILQLPPHLPADKTGMLPVFRELIPELS